MNTPRLFLVPFPAPISSAHMHVFNNVNVYKFIFERN